MCDRVVVLIDMDCFYCQVEELLNPSLKGKPIAVVQYNQWKGGGIIAVNYPARARGVTRHMRGEEAQQKCPDIVLARVPNKHNKADTSKYRDAGKRVIEVLQTFTPLLERASVDEAYLDITENVNNWLMSKKDIAKELLHDTFAVGHTNIAQFLENVYPEDESLVDENLLKLAVGACIANSIRSAVHQKTGYECSAGIAHNKVLAKLVCGINKPNKQTILPHSQLQEFYRTLPITKIRSLGGKFGEQICESLKIKYMSELLSYSEKQLCQKFNDKNGTWLYNIARGFDSEPVTQRLTSKSIGCCKKFPGRTAIKSVESLKHWLQELSEEIVERIEKDEIENSRKPTQLVIQFTLRMNEQDVSNSRSTRLASCEASEISCRSFDIICQNYTTFIDKDSPDSILFPVTFLGLNVGKFEKKNNSVKGIASFFNKLENEEYNVEQNEDSSRHISKEILSSNFENVTQRITGLSKKLGNNSMCNVGRCAYLTLNDGNITNEKINYKNLQMETEELINNVSNTKAKSAEIHDISSPSFFLNYHEDETRKTASSSVETVEAVSCDNLNSALLHIPIDNNERIQEITESKFDTVSKEAGTLENIPENIHEMSTSFFFKCYQGKVTGNDENCNGTSISVLMENSEIPICYDSRSTAATNLSINSDDSYSSTKELESILEASKFLTEVQTESMSTDVEQPTNSLAMDYKLALELSRNEQENVLKKCPECDKDVFDLVTHLDHHLALKISLQQREEFRLNQKQNASVSMLNSASKKRKKQQITSKENIKRNRTIISFFNKN